MGDLGSGVALFLFLMAWIQTRPLDFRNDGAVGEVQNVFASRGEWRYLTRCNCSRAALHWIEG